MECKTWIADEWQEGLTLIHSREEDPMEDNGQKTQDGCRATLIT